MSQPPQSSPNSLRVLPADLEPRRQEALAYLRLHVHDGDVAVKVRGLDSSKRRGRRR